MKAHTASLINAIILIILSSWGYFSSTTPSVTALIPAGVGLLLLIFNKGIKNQNKIIAHIAVLLTIIVLGGLVKPFLGAIGREDNMALARVLVMILSTVASIVFFIKNFIDVRKNKEVIKEN